MHYEYSDFHPVEIGTSAKSMDGIFSVDMFGTPRDDPGPRGPLVYLGDCPVECDDGDVCTLPAVCDTVTSSCSTTISATDGTICTDNTATFDACIDGSCSSGVCLGAPDFSFATFYDCDVKASGNVL